MGQRARLDGGVAAYGWPADISVPIRLMAARGSIRLVDRQYDLAVAAQADPLGRWHL